MGIVLKGRQTEMLDERLLFSNCVLSENRLWYISNQGYLMYMDTITGKVSYAGIKNSNDWVKHPMSDPMFAYEGCIYWVDQFGKAVHEYNIGLEEYYFYELPPVERVDSCYVGIFMYEEKLYMFPQKMPELIIFDLKKKEITIQNSLYEELFAWEEYKNNLISYYCVQHENNIYVFLPDMETVWEINLENYNSRTHCLAQKIRDIRCAVYINNFMYILTLNGNVYVWDVDSNELCEIYECREAELSFSRIIATEHKLFMLPSISEKILIMDLGDRTVFETDSYPNDLRYRENNWSKYWGYAEDEQNVWFATRTSNYLLSINKENEELKWVKMIPPNFQEETEFCRSIKHLQQKRKKEGIIQEREYGMLYFLLNFTGNVREKSEHCRENRSVGMAIWQATKE